MPSRLILSFPSHTNPSSASASYINTEVKKQSEDVLVNQLGHKHAEARKMIEEAIKRNQSIGSFEELFEEVYRGQKK